MTIKFCSTNFFNNCQQVYDTFFSMKSELIDASSDSNTLSKKTQTVVDKLMNVMTISDLILLKHVAQSNSPSSNDQKEITAYNNLLDMITSIHEARVASEKVKKIQKLLESEEQNKQAIPLLEELKEDPKCSAEAQFSLKCLQVGQLIEDQQLSEAIALLQEMQLEQQNYQENLLYINECLQSLENEFPEKNVQITQTSLSPELNQIYEKLIDADHFIFFLKNDFEQFQTHLLQYSNKLLNKLSVKELEELDTQIIDDFHNSQDGDERKYFQAICSLIEFMIDYKKIEFAEKIFLSGQFLEAFELFGEVIDYGYSPWLKHLARGKGDFAAEVYNLLDEEGELKLNTDSDSHPSTKIMLDSPIHTKIFDTKIKICENKLKKIKENEPQLVEALEFFKEIYGYYEFLRFKHETQEKGEFAVEVCNLNDAILLNLEKELYPQASSATTSLYAHYKEIFFTAKNAQIKEKLVELECSKLLKTNNLADMLILKELVERDLADKLNFDELVGHDTGSSAFISIKSMLETAIHTKIFDTKIKILEFKLKELKEEKSQL